jgi:adenosylmethionine-8-amino-7-oxononanoate aminotransferase
VTEWFTRGREHVWLPYTRMLYAPESLQVKTAHDCRLILEDGRELIDGISSWWSMCHGYQHPAIVGAIRDQAEKLSHVMFAGLAHEPAYRLAAELSSMTGLARVFFSDSGSTAVEVALKMAMQYWQNKGKTRKTKLIHFANGYHGDTFGAMSVSGRSGFHKAYDSLTTRHFQLEIPEDEYSMAECADTIAAIADSTAALIIEPLVQGAGGMHFHSPDVLAALRSLCREHEILFIADEVMTGFYRTGNRFACDEAGITPDILCLGKALTGGHIGLAATLASQQVFDAFLSDQFEHALMHGPTFMANPLACAAALASCQLFAQEDYSEKAARIETHLREALQPLEGLKGVADVRVCGAIGVVQLQSEQSDMFALREECVNRGIWLRPFGTCFYLMPPLVIQQGDLQQLTDVTRDVITGWSQSL